MSSGGQLDLTVLPAGVFDELTALTTLNLRNNSLTALPAGVFDKLTALTDLDLSFSDSLTALPAGVFDKLTALDGAGSGGQLANRASRRSIRRADRADVCWFWRATR